MGLKQSLQDIKQFFFCDLWSVKLRELPWIKRQLYVFLRIVFITVAEFKKDRVGEKSSNLTYFTLLSIVPVIAMAFGIAKGFGLKSVIEKQIQEVLSSFMQGMASENAEGIISQETIQNQLISFADNMIDSANGGVVAGVGLAVLIYLVMRLLTNIEVTFNVMWDIKKHRPLHRKLADYISVMILSILLVILSSTATVFVHTEVADLADSGIKSGVLFLIKLLPYSLIWLLLFLVYLIFPNTRVKVVPALIAGIVAGSVYQVSQWGFINFGSLIFSRYNQVYGSFALLPLFLIYIQLSWFIVLIGAELAYAMQHYNVWVPDNERLRISLRHKRKLALIIMHRIIKRFENASNPISINQLSAMGSVPSRFIGEICHELEKAGLITRIEGEKGDFFFQPAYDIHKMTITEVIKKYESEGTDDFDKNRSEAFQHLEDALIEMESTSAESQRNILLKDL